MSDGPKYLKDLEELEEDAGRMLEAWALRREAAALDASMALEEKKAADAKKLRDKYEKYDEEPGQEGVAAERQWWKFHGQWQAHKSAFQAMNRRRQSLERAAAALERGEA